MKFYSVLCEYEGRPELNEIELFAFADEDTAAKYIERYLWGAKIAEVTKLPDTDMHFTPYFGLCKGMYGIRKGMYGKWLPEDFEEATA